MNPETSHRRYNCSTEGVTEIRVVPSFNADGFPEPLILGEEVTTSNLSDAIIKVGMVSFFGKQRYSLLEVAPPKGIRQGPLQFFYNYVVNEVKTKPRTCSPDWRRWQGLRDEGDIQAPKRIISPPSATILCQGYLIQHKGQLCTDKDGNPTMKYPVVVSIKPSGSKSLLDSLLKQRDVNAPWSDDNTELGNIVALDRGQTLKIVPYETEHNGMRQTWYRCEAGSIVPITQEQAKAVWKPWKDVLNLGMTISDVIQKIAETFDARSVVQVFESDPVYRGYIPKEVWDAKAREEKVTIAAKTEAVPVVTLPYIPSQPPQVVPPTMSPHKTVAEVGIRLPDFNGATYEDEEPKMEEPLAQATAEPTPEQRLQALRNRVQR